MASRVVDLSAPTFHREQTVEQFWEVSRQCLIRGSPIIILPISLQGTIGEEGVQSIAERYSALVKAPVSVSWNNNIDAITMEAQIVVLNDQVGETPCSIEARPLPASEIASSKPLTDAIAPSETLSADAASLLNPVCEGYPEKIPKPPNAFIIYRQHHHLQVKAANPSLHNSGISVVLGKQWKNESESTKALYYSMAAEMKQRHYATNPEVCRRSRKVAKRQSRKQHSRFPTPLEAPQSFNDAGLYDHSLDFGAPSLAAYSCAPSEEIDHDQTEPTLSFDELLSKDLPVDTVAQDDFNLSILQTQATSPFEGDEMLNEAYIGDERFSQLLACELRKES